MKYFPLFCCVAIALLSCQKEQSEDNDPIPDPSSGQCQLEKMVQGVDGDDTVHLFNYDNQRRIVQVIDETNRDTQQLKYTNGLLTELSGSHRRCTYTRNGKGKITSIESSRTKTVITYTDDTVYKAASSYYPENGAWRLAGNYGFELNDAHDIISVKQYNGAGNVVKDHQVTYTDIPNPFGSIDVLNYENQLGLMDITPLFEYGFSPTKLIKTHTDGSYAYSMDYQLDDDNRVIKSIATVNYNGIRQGVFTRQYFYDCE